MSLRSRSGLNHILGLIGNNQDHARNLKRGDRNDHTANKTVKMFSNHRTIYRTTLSTGRTYLSAELFEVVNDATDVKESRRNEKPSV